MDLLKEHLGWGVGDGEKILAWKEPWLSSDNWQCPIGHALAQTGNVKVSDLFQDQTQEWNPQKIEYLFPLLMDSIMSIKPSKWGGEDKRIWLKHRSGSYTAKTGYYAPLGKHHPTALIPHSNHQDWNKEVWNLDTAPKLKLLLWRIKHDVLPVGEVLV